MRVSRIIAGLWVGALSLSACKPSQPPLMANGMEGMIGGARGLYDDGRQQADTLTSMFIDSDSGLRYDLGRRIGRENGLRTDMGLISAHCPQRASSEICTLYFDAPSPKVSAPGAGNADASSLARGILRYDAPYTNDEPPTDIPFEVTGAVVHGGGMVAFAPGVDSAPYHCRTDTVPSAGVQRRVCSVRRGLVKITFVHDVMGEGDANLDDMLGDDVLPLLHVTGVTYLDSTAASNAAVWRTLAVRTEASHGPTRSGGESMIWAVATSQSDWNLACSAAAVGHEPILVYSINDAYDPYATLADAPFGSLSDRAVLVAVLGQTPAGSDPWARAFNHGVQARNAAMITVTDIPVFKHGQCEVTRAYQAPAGFTNVDALRQIIARQ